MAIDSSLFVEYIDWHKPTYIANSRTGAHLATKNPSLANKDMPWNSRDSRLNQLLLGQQWRHAAETPEERAALHTINIRSCTHVVFLIFNLTCFSMIEHVKYI